MSKRLTKAELRAELDAELAQIKAEQEANPPQCEEGVELYAATMALAEAERDLILAPPTKKHQALDRVFECIDRQCDAKVAMENKNAAMAAEVYQLQQENAALEVLNAKLKGALPGEVDRIAAEHRAKLTVN